MPSLVTRVQYAWNAFMNKDPTMVNYGTSSSFRPDRKRLYNNYSKTIVNTIYNKIAVDVAAIDLKEVLVDSERKFQNDVESGLNTCLRVGANIDQTARMFKQDMVMSMFDEGVIAVVPVDTDHNPHKGVYEICTLRTGKIVEWYPQYVKVRLYNDNTGEHEELIFHKNFVAILENPFYSIMNEQNSTLQRLIRLLNDIECINKEASSNKLNLLIQLPYTVKNSLRKQQAEDRRKEIEDQLIHNQYGIAYIDGTEHVTQLGRPLENNLWQQATALTDQLYNQLGLTKSIFDGTADEATILNYNNAVLYPIVDTIAQEFERKFLTQTARSRGHAIKYFSDPFKIVPVNNIAEIADKFTRNEIMSSNEFRTVIGLKPVDDQRANELRNKNLNASKEQEANPLLIKEENQNE